MKMKIEGKFDKYIRLKKELAGVGFDSVKVPCLAGFFIAELCYVDGALNFFKKLVRNFLLVPRIEFVPSSDKALFGWSIARPDYSRLSDAYKQNFGCDFEDLCLSGDMTNWHLQWDARALSMSLCSAMSIKGTIKERLIVFSSAYAGANYLRYLDKSLDGVSPLFYLSFNSSFRYESVLTLYFRRKNIKTYSLQHGMYIDYKNDKPIDIINYENCTAAVLLLWGEFTKKQIEKKVPSDVELRVAGYPLLGGGDLKALARENPCLSKKIIVLLPRVVYRKECFRLLDILSDSIFCEYTFRLKLHPNFDVESVKSYIQAGGNVSLIETLSLDDILSEGGWRLLISFNSTALFESCLYGIPAAQFVSGNDEFLDEGFQQFNSVSELMSILESNTLAGRECGYFFADVCSDWANTNSDRRGW